MRAQEIMTKAVKTVSSTTSAQEASDLMARNKIHHLMVRDKSKLVGVVSDRDLGGRRAGRLRQDLTVGDVMTRDVVAVDPAATIRKIANVMRGRSIGCVAVTSGSRVLGIITVSDILSLLGRGRDRPVRAAERSTMEHLSKRNRFRRQPQP